MPAPRAEERRPPPPPGPAQGEEHGGHERPCHERRERQRHGMEAKGADDRLVQPGVRWSELAEEDVQLKVTRTPRGEAGAQKQGHDGQTDEDRPVGASARTPSSLGRDDRRDEEGQPKRVEETDHDGRPLWPPRNHPSLRDRIEVARTKKCQVPPDNKENTQAASLSSTTSTVVSRGRQFGLAAARSWLRSAR